MPAADESTVEGAALRGALGFGLVSLAAVVGVSYGGQWLFDRLGFLAFGVFVLVFAVLGWLSLIGMVEPEERVRFSVCYGVAFGVYGTTLMFFDSLGGSLAQWIGALVGWTLVAAVFALGFAHLEALPSFAATLFGCHAVGYLAGSTIDGYGQVAYGAFVGAGLGAVLYLSRQIHGGSSRKEDSR